MSNETNNYLKHDLLMLLVLGVIIAGVLTTLWYIEQHGGDFSRFATQLLDASAQ